MYFVPEDFLQLLPVYPSQTLSWSHHKSDSRRVPTKECLALGVGLGEISMKKALFFSGYGKLTGVTQRELQPVL